MTGRHENRDGKAGFVRFRVMISMTPLDYHTTKLFEALLTADWRWRL